MSYKTCNPCCPKEEEISCEEESTAQVLCRHERYIEELFKRTDYLKDQLTGSGVGPFRISFASDAGQVTADQASLAANMEAFQPDIYLFGGDNNYEAGEQATITANWAVFQTKIDQGIVYPALGQVDIDTDPLGGPQTTKFTYLPGNKRYYHVYFEEGSLDLYVLNSGINSLGALVEPDGNKVDSVQYRWFLNEIAQSCGKWRIVMFHHPFVSQTQDALASGKIVPDMDWNYEIFGVDLVLNGHTHTAQHLRFSDMDILDVSSSVRALGTMSPTQTIYGPNAVATDMIWPYADPGLTGPRLYATIEIVGNAMFVSVRRVDNGDAVYAFPITK